jgi:hypothetical protein
MATNYIYTGKPNLTFANASVGTLFYDLRNICGFGILKVESVVSTGPVQGQKIIAVNQVTGQKHHIPKNDFWAFSV